MNDRLSDPAEERHPDHVAQTDHSARPEENPTSYDDSGAPLGGDGTTEEQLDADNEVEEDAIKALDPDDSPG